MTSKESHLNVTQNDDRGRSEQEARSYVDDLFDKVSKKSGMEEEEEEEE